jgi:hypothetical protein
MSRPSNIIPTCQSVTRHCWKAKPSNHFRSATWILDCFASLAMTVNHYATSYKATECTARRSAARPARREPALRRFFTLRRDCRIAGSRATGAAGMTDRKLPATAFDPLFYVNTSADVSQPEPGIWYQRRLMRLVRVEPSLPWERSGTRNTPKKSPNGANEFDVAQSLATPRNGCLGAGC